MVKEFIQSMHFGAGYYNRGSGMTIITQVGEMMTQNYPSWQPIRVLPLD